MNQHDGILRERLPFINSLTKYPSIPCWHPMGDRGVMADAPDPAPPGPYIATEKIDGTNARIIITAGHYLIGSREELLTHSDDIVHNPSQGIVDAVRPIAEGLREPKWPGLTVIYGEVYGGKVGANAKNYGPSMGFRVFDAMEMVSDEVDQLSTLDPFELAQWRDGGGQRFIKHDRLAMVCERLHLPMVPLITKIAEVPKDQPTTLAWLNDNLGNTRASENGGPAEGFVLRTADRSWIVKIRREDYERAARRRPQNTHPSAMA